MKLYKNIFGVVLLLFCASLYAQQEPNYSLYRYTMNVINPSYAGADGTSSLAANFRSQWVNVRNAPETQSFFYSTPISDKIGLGVSVVNDQVFIENRTSFVVDFSYKVQLDESLNLFLGIKAGGNTYNIDTDGLAELDFPSDPALGNIDTGFSPNVGFGAHLAHEKYFVSLSVPRIILSDRAINDNGVVTTGNDNTHVYLSGGYNIQLGSNVEFRPSTMLRFITGAPFSMDITAAFRFNQRFELGALYRTDDAFAGVMMLNLADWMDLGYAYETSTRSEITDASDGTHEIFVKFIFGRNQKEKEEE
ncbi:MAG: type IX secretion system membrane protein PorP/SprF [Bacteroidota bacterium]